VWELGGDARHLQPPPIPIALEPVAHALEQRKYQVSAVVALYVEISLIQRQSAGRYGRAGRGNAGHTKDAAVVATASSSRCLEADTGTLSTWKRENEK
jgi:hypothetical protein